MAFKNRKKNYPLYQTVEFDNLRTMTEDAVIYADSEELNGFAAWLPFGFTGSRAIPFLLK